MGADKLDKVNGIGTEAVRARTGKGWAEWFKLLDAAGAVEMNHTAIAAHLREKHGCPRWWNQMVAVGYEQERGLRAKHQDSAGDFSASASKTIAVPLDPLFAAWMDAKVRRRWLSGATFTVSKATPNKSIRMAWADDGTRVEVMFYPKRVGKSQVTVQHGKLADAAAVAERKAYWQAALGRLKGLLES
ncbi:MAG TPA: DUF4287 domain-containing protein [Gemmataceae bacterium]|jgi:uncharacterized protein YndB with AHSA1/START domain